MKKLSMNGDISAALDKAAFFEKGEPER